MIVLQMLYKAILCSFLLFIIIKSALVMRETIEKVHKIADDIEEIKEKLSQFDLNEN